MQKRSFICAVLALAIPLQASAQDMKSPFNTGNDFIRECAKSSWEMMCLSYAIGVYQGSQVKTRSLCLPVGVDNQQLLAIATTFIKSRPDMSHYPASSLLLASWERQFACVK
jgi:Rap1a immunity proteins